MSPPASSRPELLGLLAACKESPDDDAPRLILADWLEEHGEPERARFIRLQLERAATSSRFEPTSPCDLMLPDAEGDLAAAHDEWFSAYAGCGRPAFRRGLV